MRFTEVFEECFGVFPGAQRQQISEGTEVEVILIPPAHKVYMEAKQNTEQCAQCKTLL